MTSHYLMQIGCGLACALMSTTLLLSVVGTASPQMYGAYGSVNENKMVGERWYLYQLMTTVDDATRSHFYTRDSMPCPAMFDRYIAAFAFAILSCVCAAVGTLTSGVCAWKAGGRREIQRRESQRSLGAEKATGRQRMTEVSGLVTNNIKLSSLMYWSIVANFAFLTLAWTLSESVRTMRSCAGRKYSPAETGYRSDSGMALLVAAWCINGAGACIASIFLSR